MYCLPISEALAEAGAHVVIASRNLAACERAAASLSSDGHEPVPPSSTIRGTKHPSSLSGTACKSGSAESTCSSTIRSPDPCVDMKTPQAWRESMDVNATGVFAVSRAFLDLMMKRGSGSVINIGSIHSVPAPGGFRKL